MSAEHEGLEGKHDRLEPQNQGVDQREGIHNVQGRTPHGAGVLRHDHVVVVGVGVGDAAAAGRYAVEPAFIERLKQRQKRAWLLHLLRFDQLLASPEGSSAWSRV